MAWTELTRAKYRRDGLRYASDTTDEEWAVIVPHLPPPADRGRTRHTSLREVVNSIFYDTSLKPAANGVCLPPKDFPPFTTVQRYFYAWRDKAHGRDVDGVPLD
jgi:transposase